MDEDHVTTLKKNLALQLATARIEQDMTTLELSQAAGVPLTTVQEAEAGCTDELYLDDLTKLAQALNLSISIKFVPQEKK